MPFSPNTLIGLVVAVAAAAVNGASVEINADTAKDMASFKQFQAEYRTGGYVSDAEHASRFAVFRRNLKDIDQLNAEAAAEEGSTVVFAVGKFADLTLEEFQSKTQGKPKPGGTPDYPNTHVRKTPSGFQPPPAVDWREKGVVGDVRDQGDCGGCWAFSATETVESGWAMAGQPLVNLSVQEVVSCDKHSNWHCPDDDDCKNVDAGCDGGDPVFGVLFICNKTHGLATEQNYPYKSGKGGHTGKCATPNKPTDVPCTGFSWGNIPCDKGKCSAQNEDMLKANVAFYGPAAVSVNAGGNGWQHYKNGVYPASKCPGQVNKLDHAVQLVGYGIDGTTNAPFWLVRNSWASDWGEGGYIRLAYGTNTCGVTDQPLFADFPGKPYEHL